MTTITKDHAKQVTDPTAVARLMYAESMARLQGMLSVFARADRTLSGLPVECKMEHHPGKNAPAWSDGKTITFNAPKVGSIHTTDDYIKVTGLNFHELCHIMYTPRVGSYIVDQVVVNNAFHAFNILEDQRIESMMAAKYLSTKAYFQMVILRYLLNDKSTWDRQHILTYGRRYLPDTVRDELRRRFKHQADLAELEDLIDSYRQIAYPSDEQQALHIILRFKALLQKFQQDANTQPPPDPFGHSGNCRPEVTEGQPYDGEQQEDTQTWVEEGYDDWEDPEEDDDDQQGAGGESDEADDSEDDESDGPGQGGDWEDDDDADDDYNGGDTEDDSDDDADGDDGDSDGDADSDDDADGSQDGDGESDDDSNSDGDAGDQSDKDGDDDSDQDGGDSDEDTDGNGSSGDDGSHSDPSVVDQDDFLDDDELREAINDIYDGLSKSEPVMDDLRTRERAIAKTTGQLPTLDVKHYREYVPSLPWKKASANFGKELNRLWADSDPGWNRYQNTGKVNVGRVMRGDDLDTVFDQWDEGVIQANDIDMVILVDYSSSMKGQMDTVSQALWAIKHAVESIHGDVTVLGFNQDATTFYTRHDKAKKNAYRLFGAEDWTDPGVALSEAFVMLKHSQRKHKIVLILTDGAWDNEAANNDVIKVMNANGILTGLGFLGDDRYIRTLPPEDQERDWLHYCKARATFTNATGLAGLAKALVKEAMTAR